MLDARSVASGGHLWSAACRARSAGLGMVGMCFRSVRGLLDWRRGSAVGDVCLAGGSLGPPRLCKHPRGRRLPAPRGAACG